MSTVAHSRNAMWSDESRLAFIQITPFLSFKLTHFSFLLYRTILWQLLRLPVSHQNFMCSPCVYHVNLPEKT